MMRLRTEDLVWQDLDDDLVILDLRASTYLRLNDTAAVLFRELDRTGSTEALVTKLRSEYEVATEDAERDVQSFLSRLSDYDLIADAPQT